MGDSSAQTWRDCQRRDKPAVNRCSLSFGGSIPSLSTNYTIPVGPARRGERTVNPHAAGSIPAAGATALWCQWLAWLSVEQQDGDRNPVGPPNIFMPRALGPQPSFTRKGGSVQFTDEVPSSQVALKISQVIGARLPLVFVQKLIFVYF